MATLIGFDTATPRTAVAALAGDEVLAEVGLDPPAGSRPLHATRLLAEIERAAEASGGWAEVDRLAVGVGPGSFTGLRVAVATGRALAGAHRLDLVAVGTLEALAAGIHERHPQRSALAVVDARRGEVFAALHAPGGGCTWKPVVSAPDALAARLAELPEPPLAAGDGALRFRDELVRGGVEIPAEADPVHGVAARHVCSLARERRPVDPDWVVPTYLRAPDAQRWRERDRGKADRRSA